MKATPWTQHEGPFTRYLLSCGKSPETARTYCSGVSLLWRWCARYETTPFDIGKPDLRDWFAERLSVVSPGRCHTDHAGVHLFYMWLKETGYRDDDPTEGIRIKRGKRLPTKPLEPRELDALVSNAGSERDRLIVLLLAYTGLRITELAGLTADDVDWERGEIRVRGKGDKDRRIAPKAEVLNRLHAFCGMFPVGPIWVSQWRRPLVSHQIRKIIYAIAAKAGVENVHPHRFRAFFATQYIDRFADIQALQGVMGHQSIETTSRYSEWTREKRGLTQMRELDFGIRSA